MPRASKSGVRGLYVDSSGRRRIDMRYTDGAGKPQRYKEVFPTGAPKRAVEKRAQTILAEAIMGTLQNRDTPAATTLSDAFDQYLRWVQINRPRSYRDRKSIVTVWKETVGDPSIDELGSGLLEKYKAARLEAKAAPATVNRGLAIVKHMAGLAVRSNWGWMNRANATEIGEVTMLSEPPGRQRALKPAELDALFAAFQRKDSRFARRVVAASLLTGCRLGEILGLKEGDVDLQRGFIDLSHTKQNRNHQIVITEPMRNLLIEALADRGQRHGGYVFTSSRGARYTVSGFSRHYARVAERAGIPATYHDIRRTCGTRLVNSGVRLEVVSKLLGHSTVAVTQRSYAHLATESTRAAFEALARVAPVLPSTSTNHLSNG